MGKIPFYKSIPYRNINLHLSEPPYPQENSDDWSICNKTVDDYDLFICESGSAEFSIHYQKYTLFPGQALLIPPHCPINAKKTSKEPVRMLAQHFMLCIFHKTDFFSHIKYRNLISFSNWQLVRTLINEIRTIISKGTDCWSPMDTNPIFMVILHSFIQDAYLAEDLRKDRKSFQVLKMISLIEEGYKKNSLLEDLMKSSDYGYSHTANIFKEYTGTSLKSFIIERRLESAKEVLLEQGSIREAAEAAGYEDEFYFSRIFKKYTGASPKEYRFRI